MHGQSIDRQQWALQQLEQEIAESARLADMPAASFRSFGAEGDSIWTAERIEAFRRYFRNYADCLSSHRQEAHSLPVSSACAQGKPPVQVAIEQQQERERRSAQQLRTQWVEFIALTLSVAVSVALSLLATGSGISARILGALSVFPGAWLLCVGLAALVEYATATNPNSPNYWQIGLAYPMAFLGGLWVLTWRAVIGMANARQRGGKGSDGP